MTVYIRSITTTPIPPYKDRFIFFNAGRQRELLMSLRKRRSLASVSSGQPLEKRSFAKDISLNSATSGAAVLKIKDALTSDVMSPAVVRLPEQSDEDPAIIISDDALRKYGPIYNVSQEQTVTLEDEGYLSMRNFLLATRFLTFGETLGFRVLKKTALQKNASKAGALWPYSKPGDHVRFFCFSLQFSHYTEALRTWEAAVTKSAGEEADNSSEVPPVFHYKTTSIFNRRENGNFFRTLICSRYTM